MTTIHAVRDIGIDAGHRVCNHESKCAHLHGHRYRIELHARSTNAIHGGRQLDDIGRVVDFSVLKARVGRWLDEEWDHRFLLWEKDPLVESGVVAGDEAAEIWASSVVEVPFNPTAENIGRHLLEVVCPMLLGDLGIEVAKVVVHETPNCRAEVTL